LIRKIFKSYTLFIGNKINLMMVRLSLINTQDLKDFSQEVDYLIELKLQDIFLKTM